jgi:hypothetical protein
MSQLILRTQLDGVIVFDFGAMADENPSSLFAKQGARDCTDFQNVRTVGGKLFGTQRLVNPSGTEYDDSLGFYDFGSKNVALKGVVYKDPAITFDVPPEIELFQCCTPAANSAPGYEHNFDCNGVPTIIEQAGPRGSFDTTGNTTHFNPGAIATGDVFKSIHYNGESTMWLNNVKCVTRIDSTHTGTWHGFAFFNRPGTVDTNFGFSIGYGRVIDGVNFTIAQAEAW